ncbi:outer membrane lipoprotein chaperone LolA [Piscinibacter sakaiensis]|uniref:Outer-membrane lipoprotein carrier protein n=1 Tax=Piscinibacter sakaiensis TaxID=1547922 RepID=A0A0K8NTL5_PISS1|nr:outer membrane lipoprotein chaperone LolA [Piscinibacter sakaiensis]GAP33624.1 outer membrane lipoprotein carrier protein LolA [Piscinibacter sakaiensis]
MTPRRALLGGLAGLVLAAALPVARADAVDALRSFARDVRSGSADFTQTVTAPDGVRKKQSSGRFEFSRPNRFRFAYTKPFEQLIVADGQKVWIYDADLNQASSRRIAQALGATPAALLAGGSLEQDFTLAAQPDRDGLAWVQAVPKSTDAGIRAIRVGFRAGQLAALEITDGFGQRSRLDFSNFTANPNLPAERFRFTLPPGADLLEQ